MTLAALILHAMLAVACPGTTSGSRIELPDCDRECLATARLMTGSAPRRGFVFMRARWPGWSRQETEGEALVRWAGIAEGIARVVADPPPAWRWEPDELGPLLVTIAMHESHFWRSVQEGRLRGPAGEWGLFQCHPAVLGCSRRMTGLDVDSVERAARFAAQQLARARVMAERYPCERMWWLPTTLTVYAIGHRGCDGFATLEERLHSWDLVTDKRRDPLPFGALFALAEVR